MQGHRDTYCASSIENSLHHMLDIIRDRTNSLEFNKLYQCLTSLKNSLLSIHTEPEYELSVRSFCIKYLTCIKSLPVTENVEKSFLIEIITKNILPIFVILSSLFYKPNENAIILQTHNQIGVVSSVGCTLSQFTFSVMEELEIIKLDSTIRTQFRLNAMESCARHVFTSLHEMFPDLLGEACLALVSFLLASELPDKDGKLGSKSEDVLNYLILQATYGQSPQSFFSVHARIMLLLKNLVLFEHQLK